MGNQDKFLTELEKMFRRSKSESEKSRTTGSVLVSMKRACTQGGEIKSLRKRKAKKGSKPVVPDECDSACLLRAKYKNMKISTTVSSKDCVRFQMQYANILKIHLDGLKKKEKDKKPQAKAGDKKPSTP